jgi:pimeloyl-ACP methyl ester carboxylesterase
MRSAHLFILLLLVSLRVTAAEVRTEEVRFQSHGTTLSGSIVFPTDATHAAVVFIHGSGPQARGLHWAERFAQAGIAALVYDKRGAGKSGGVYEGEQSVSEKNLALLADDAVAALHVLAAHEKLKAVPTGFAGISQAGWIAPLAADRTRLARFLLLWSGPVCQVSEEDIYSKYTADTDRAVAPPYLEAVKARTAEYHWPAFLGKDTDSADSLRKLAIPGLWIFSDNDSSVPVDLSIRRLQSLRASGLHYDYVLFSGLGHNNMDRTFSVATDWLVRLNATR